MIIGTRSAKTCPEMSAILPTVDLSLGDNLFTTVDHNITAVGQIFGKPEKAADMVAELGAKIAHLKQVVPKAGTALILVTNGGKVGAHGPTSRVGWIHAELGFATIEDNIDDRFHGGDVISLEYNRLFWPDIPASPISAPPSSARLVSRHATRATAAAVIWRPRCPSADNPVARDHRGPACADGCQ
jgi:ABC-type enterochelin transport system substrate-binding protein